MRLKDFIKLYNERKSGCIAYGYNLNGTEKYYSINGKARSWEPLPPVHILAEAIIGDNPTFCGYEDSFTVLTEELPASIHKFDDYFYDLFDMFDQCLSFPIIGEDIYADDPKVNKYGTENGYFTCAEKKIIGHLKRKDKEVGNIYSTKEPCYHCLPTIKTVYYLRHEKRQKGERIRIQRITRRELCTCDPACPTTFEFTHKL